GEGSPSAEGTHEKKEEAVQHEHAGGQSDDDGKAQNRPRRSHDGNRAENDGDLKQRRREVEVGALRHRVIALVLLGGGVVRELLLAGPSGIARIRRWIVFISRSGR